MDFDYHILIRSIPLLMNGLGWTLLIATTAILGGTGLGLGLCAFNLSNIKSARWLSRTYIEFFRTTPEMVLIFWVYFCFPPLFDVRLSAFWSGTLALTLVAGAYLAEIFRAGIQSLGAGQGDAAKALGLKWRHRWAFVILPQAFRRMIPAIMAYLTELLKNTALLSAIGVTELAYRASTLGAETFRYMEFLSAVGIIFFGIIYPVSLTARILEGRFLRRT